MISALFTITAAIFAGPVQAQFPGNMVQQNMQFDQQMNSMLMNQQAQLQQQQAAMIQSYIQQNGAQLQQDYQQYIQTTGQQIPFQQFVYYHIMTQGGRNPGPGLQAQQDSFRGMQQANRTLQEGYQSYNQGWQANQQTTDNIYNRYTEQAIRGNGQYYNPATGETQTLPLAPQPGYYQGGGNSYYGDPSGNYHQVDPLGYQQQLEQRDNYQDSGDD